jgi:hypothetical protein
VVLADARKSTTLNDDYLFKSTTGHRKIGALFADSGVFLLCAEARGTALSCFRETTMTSILWYCGLDSSVGWFGMF